MPTQHGPIQLTGTLGEVTFYKTADGYKAKMKSGPTGRKFKIAKCFARSREAGVEFGRAGKAMKLIKAGLGPFLSYAADNRFYGRLTAQLVKVIRSDELNRRGERRVHATHLHLLRGFLFKKGEHAGLDVRVTEQDSGICVTVELRQPLTARDAAGLQLFACVSDVDFTRGIQVSERFSSRIFSPGEKGIRFQFACKVADHDAIIICCGVGYATNLTETDSLNFSSGAMEISEVVPRRSVDSLEAGTQTLT